MKKCAMVLEDDGAIRELVEQRLVEHGYEVRAYASPVECMIDTPLEIEGKAGPDVIISDNRMPHVSGLEYVRGLRGAGREVPHIALMSGDWHPDELKEARAMGCKTFFKPFSVSMLDHWLRALPIADEILSE